MHKDKDKGRINEYFDGMIEGMRLYAWWKDGVEYVGTTGRTLKEALTAIEDERKKVLNSVS
jgi:hypothetical protein